MIRKFLSLITIAMLGGCTTMTEQFSSFDNLDAYIGQKIMVGFKGTTPQDPEVQQLSALIQSGKVGGIIFFAYNIKSPHQIRKLTQHFLSLKTPTPIMLAIDQEGGKVQRLSAKNGFEDFDSAKQVTAKNNGAQVYAHMAKVVKDAGFNVALGPVVDLESNDAGVMNPVIGKLERSYSADPNIVVRQSVQFVKAMHQRGILTALKHFPGHGLASGDTHAGLVNVTATFKQAELQPYYDLVANYPECVDMIMTAHVMHKKYDTLCPATLSPEILGTLLRKRGYDGVIISDCLYMGAITQNFNFDTIIKQATLAGVDIMIFSRNNAASINNQASTQQQSLTDFVNAVHHTLRNQISQQQMPVVLIASSYQRITKLKNMLKKVG